MWTRFMDMSSGGYRKEKWAYIFIEAPEQEAKVIFYNRFGHNPERVSCTCCGQDYSIAEEAGNLADATVYARCCTWNKEARTFNNDGEPLEAFCRVPARCWLFGRMKLSRESVSEKCPNKAMFWRG